MKTSLPEPNSILQQIAAISTLELGKLASYVPPGRPASTQPCFKLQSWQKGKNVTRHVRSEPRPQLQAALEGDAPFRQRCEPYAQLRVERTRADWEKDSKKKQLRPSTRRSPRNSK